ncbi:hypothetical protein U9M48_027539 [Paspalum notatum var. saurae]|uniref:Uncharacterized protein n=1 Tax=Paspalum notatum var. saurae TaxID=547442 RepID=A0AAQ3X0J8_PASNO
MALLFGIPSQPAVPPCVLDELAGDFAKTHSHDENERFAAKQRISSCAGTASVLALLALAGSADHEDAARLDASAHVSDILLRRWPPSPDSVDRRYFLPIDRPIIKSCFGDVFFNAPPRIQAQLAEALGAAAAFDPVDWTPPFLLSIIDRLDTALSNHDLAASNPLLAVLSSLFSRAVHLDPIFPLRDFADSHLNLFEVACNCFQGQPGGVTCSTFEPLGVTRSTFELLRHCCEIFYWLKSVHFPDYFKNMFSKWSGGFYSILEASRSGDVEDIAALTELQIAVIRILQLYIQRHREEMCLEGLMTSVIVVRDLFLQVAADGGCLVLTVLRFFTTAIEELEDYFPSFHLFCGRLGSALVDMLRPQHEDEVLFDGNPMEYIKCDSEGSDADTHRWAVCRLLRVLVLNSWRVDAVVSMHFSRVLNAYAGQDNNWKETYLAVYLVIALMKKPGEIDKSAFTMFESGIDTFFQNVIVPELEAPDWKSEPMLKAAVLKFLKEFMHEMPKATALGLLPSVFKFLLHESTVVRSYAATFIENLLIVKDMAPVVPGVNTVTSYQHCDAGDINLYAPEIVQNLSVALCFPDSLENPCIMKCLMQVLGMANIAGPTAQNVTSRLVATLIEVCNDPKDSDFSYCLFEVLAAVIGQADGQDLALLTIFEAGLSPLLWRIMDESITEFWPYAIQILAQLVDFRRPPLSLNDKKLFGVVVSDVVWDRPPCVPAMLCLLRAFFHKFPDDLHQAGMLEQFLRLCCDRLKEISSEDSAMKMLSTLVETVSQNIMGQYMLSIWSVLFDRARYRRVAEYLNSLGLFMSLVVERYGLPFLVTSTNDDSWHMLYFFLDICWIPNLKLIKGALKVKQAVVFSTKLLCTYQGLLSAVATAPELWLWGKLLDSTITLLSDQDGAQQEQNDSAGLLQHSSRGYDLLSYVEDPKKFLVTSLATLSAESPGRFLPIIQKYVNQVNQRPSCDPHGKRTAPPIVDYSSESKIYSHQAFFLSGGSSSMVSTLPACKRVGAANQLSQIDNWAATVKPGAKLAPWLDARMSGVAPAMMKGVHLVCQLKKREKVFKRQRPRRSESGMTETQRWPLQQQLQQSKLSEVAVLVVYYLVVGVSLSLVDGGPHLAAGGGCPHLQRLAGPGSLPSSDRKGDVGIAGRTSVQDRLEAAICVPRCCAGDHGSIHSHRRSGRIAAKSRTANTTVQAQRVLLKKLGFQVEDAADKDIEKKFKLAFRGDMSERKQRCLQTLLGGRFDVVTLDLNLAGLEDDVT